MSRKKLSTNALLGSYENRVFIGGNYDLLPVLREIKKFVEKVGFTPILAYDFSVPEEATYDYDLRLLHNCKYAIFDETLPAGEIAELDRATRDYEKVVFVVYQIRDSDDKRPPPQISRMITSLRLPMFGYSTIEELEHFVLEIFTVIKQKPKVDWGRVTRIAWLPKKERTEIIEALKSIDVVFRKELDEKTCPVFAREHRLMREPLRFLTLEKLCILGETSFANLRDALKKEIRNLTDGNLAARLRSLEEAGYVKARRYFKGKKARTDYSITNKGKNAFEWTLISLADRYARTRKIIQAKK